MARRRRRARRRRGGRRRVNKIRWSGGLVRGRMHPPTSHASPWNTLVLTNSLTFEADADGLTCFSSSTVRKAVKSEIGVNAATPIDVRILRMDTWVPPVSQNTDKNYIVFAPCDWTNLRTTCANAVNINWFEAWGTSVQPAHVHYVWPRSISNVVLPNDTDVLICQYDVKKSTVPLQYILKLHVMWRPSIPDPRPAGYGVLTPMRMARMSDDFELVGSDHPSVSPLVGMVNQFSV